VGGGMESVSIGGSMGGGEEEKGPREKGALDI